MKTGKRTLKTYNVDDELVEWFDKQGRKFNASDFVNDACKEKIAAQESDVAQKEADKLNEEAEALKREAAQKEVESVSKKHKAEALAMQAGRLKEVEKVVETNEQVNRMRESRLDSRLHVLQINKDNPTEVKRLAEMHSKELLKDGFEFTPEQLIVLAFPERKEIS